MERVHEYGLEVRKPHSFHNCVKIQLMCSFSNCTCVSTTFHVHGPINVQKASLEAVVIVVCVLAQDEEEQNTVPLFEGDSQSQRTPSPQPPGEKERGEGERERERVQGKENHI